MPDPRVTSAITVRPVRKSDFAAWLPLWAGYNRFYGRFGPTALADEITAMKSWTACWAAALLKAAWC